MSLCETAFQAHDEFLASWGIAKMTGLDEDLQDAAEDLSAFAYLASIACEE